MKDSERLGRLYLALILFSGLSIAIGFVTDWHNVLAPIPVSWSELPQVFYAATSIYSAIYALVCLYGIVTFKRRDQDETAST